MATLCTSRAPGAPPGQDDALLRAEGLLLVDLDSDGDLDVFIANGHIFDSPERQGTTYAERAFLMWNDGDPDIAVSSSGMPLQLLRNDGPGVHWLGVELSGRKSNRRGIGARLVAELPSGRRLTRLVHAGNSYLASSDLRVLFGLGAETSVKALTIYWPPGLVQTVKDLPAEKCVTIVER